MRTMRKMSCEEIESIKATLTINNMLSLAVFEIDYNVNDSLKTALVIGNERSPFVWCKVRYDKEGDAYINRLGERYYLQYFM